MRVILFLLLLIGLQWSNAQPVVNPTTQTVEEIVLQFIVEAGQVECFYQPVTDPKHVSLELDYQVTEGGELDISFLVKNPQNVQIAYDAKKREGTHRFVFLFCF
jgi:hypothetical protein